MIVELRPCDAGARTCVFMLRLLDYQNFVSLPFRRALKTEPPRRFAPPLLLQGVEYFGFCQSSALLAVYKLAAKRRFPLLEEGGVARSAGVVPLASLPAAPVQNEKRIC